MRLRRSYFPQNRQSMCFITNASSFSGRSNVVPRLRALLS